MRFLRVFGAVVAAGLGTAASQADVITSAPFVGVTHHQITDATARPNVVNLVEIDLTADGIAFQITPGNGDPNGPEPGDPNGETFVETTRNYVSRVGAQIGINGSFFNLGGSPNNNNGLLVSDGDLLSPHDSARWDSLNITMDNIASIVTAGAPGSYDVNPDVPLYNAVAGSHRLITNGDIVAPGPGADFLSLHPRTAVGVTADRRLLLMTVDGRQPGYSEGMYLTEVASLLQSYGATDALNLDGGGSTTLAMDYYYDGQGTQVINSTAGGERANGSNLAIFALATTPPPPPLPPNLVLIDTFTGNEGRFTGGPSSGSNRGLNNAATVFTHDASEGMFDDGGSQKITIVTDKADADTGFLLRNLSGGGAPGNNLELDLEGYIGFFLKTTTPGLEVSLTVDEEGTSRTEVGAYRAVIADGEWHLYEWRTTDAGDWNNFNAGNGELNGAFITVDALILRSAIEQDAVVHFDHFAQNTTGSLELIVPEPGSLSLLLGLPLLVRRGRRSTHT